MNPRSNKFARVEATHIKSNPPPPKYSVQVSSYLCIQPQNSAPIDYWCDMVNAQSDAPSSALTADRDFYREAVSKVFTYSHVGQADQIDQTDHDIDHLDPNLPL